VPAIAQEAPALPIGHVVAGRYAVRELLGAGGMGAVYEVEAPGGARYAMKAPLPEAAEDAVASKRFAREANAMQLLDHPNLVRAVDLVAEAGRLYLVLELVRGPSLADVLRQGRLAPRRALVLARQILDGLEHAHGQGVVHRDLKPDNIVLVAAGAPGQGYEQVKILDFGLVKLLDAAAAAIGGDALTRTGITFGTPLYMPPEQALGRAVDGRADLYALGVMIFEMLAGTPPFSGKDPPALLRAHVATPAPRLTACAPGEPWVTPAVEALVGGALVKKPDDRFASAAVMRAALDDAFLSLQHLP
jgi:eukaryotic-like serine/threonine-protein kinase